MTTTRQMLERHRAALAVDHGGGFDLSASGAVLVGAYDVPPMGQRFVCLYPGASVMSSDWMDLREPSYAQTMMVLGYEPAEGHDPASRVDAALALGEVLSGAIHAIWLGASPPARARDHRVTLQAIDPAVTDLGLTSHGIIAIEVGYVLSGTAGVI